VQVDLHGKVLWLAHLHMSQHQVTDWQAVESVQLHHELYHELYHKLYDKLYDKLYHA